MRHFNVCKAIILFDIFNVVSPGLHFLSNVMKDIESKELIYIMQFIHFAKDGPRASRFIIIIIIIIIIFFSVLLKLQLYTVKFRK